MPAFLIGLFALGTIGFWILIPLLALLLFIMVENEKPGWATSSVIFAFVLLAYCGDFNLWFVVHASPFVAILAGLTYEGIGAVWSFGRWWFLSRARRVNYNAFRGEYMERHGLPRDAEIPNNLKKDFKDRIETHQRSHFREEDGHKPINKPLFRDHGGRLYMWMTFWPWSMTWTLINDPIRHLGRWLVDQFQGIYQHIADSTFKGTEKDTVYIEEKLKDEGIIEEH